MYTDINTAFVDNTQELDMMAKQINNKKNNLFNSVYDDYNKQKLKWDQDIREYNTGKMHPNNLSISQSQSQSDLASELLIDTITNNSKDSDSVFDSISIDSPELDSIIDSGKFKNNSIHKYINSKKNIDKCHRIKKGEDIFLHIKNCYDCRDKLIKHLKGEDKKNIINKTNIINKKNILDKFESIEYGELALIIVIGIIIIFILDFLMHSLIR